MKALKDLMLAIFMISTLTLQVLHGQENKPDRPSSLNTKILEVGLFDGEKIKGQLYLPNDTVQVKSVVVFVHGTGPGTYLNKRKSGKRVFNYFDYFGRALTEKGVAFFSYNKRGVTMGEAPPMYDQVDREKFRKVVPSVEARDLLAIVKQLKNDQALADAKVLLLGGSEGTVVAALTAEKYPEVIDALLLFGYAHENMYDIIAWQYSGAASMIRLNPIFDADNDGNISKPEYESDLEKVARNRKVLMQNASFEVLDANKDDRLTKEDFAIRTKPLHNLLLYNTAHNNEDWIWTNYFRISVPWLQEHFALEPNKTRLLRLDLPIFIFHGSNDAHVPVSSLKDLERRYSALNKDNLSIHEFENHDHNLNFDHWLLHNEPSEGLKKIIETAAAFSNGIPVNSSN